MTALWGALAIGISLGLLGAGGSIITVPILVFILHRPEKQAIAESLAIVGSIALIGSIPYMLTKQVQWKSVLFFGVPGMIGACLGGCGSYFVSGTLQLILFACIMLTVAGMMLSNEAGFNRITFSYQSNKLTIAEGFLVGCLTGFIGIGGGFLIVPSLMILCNLSMSLAIGTSLVIIAMNAFAGFFEQLIVLHFLHLSVDWRVIMIVASAGMLGSLSGSWIGKQVPRIYLRKAFGVTILMMGSYILLKDFL